MAFRLTPLSNPLRCSYVCPQCIVWRSFGNTAAASSNPTSKHSHTQSKALRVGQAIGQRAIATTKTQQNGVEIKKGNGHTHNMAGRNSLLEVLEERGLVHDIAGDRDDLDNLLLRKKISLYLGIDPTAPSLHVGHLLPLMILFWMCIYGHSTYSLVGGFTARIGDPTGRSTAREMQTRVTTLNNTASMMERVGILWERFKDHAVHRGHKNLGINIVKDNADWGQDLTVEKFLHYLGTNVRLGAMLSRDTVKTRMESGNGMSYAEFTYPLLQAWDFRHLYLTHGVQLQIGGSDQYGNIVAGIEAAKQSQEEPNTARKTGPTDAPYGLTVPLLTTPSGAKFGKSAGNAVWLDEKRTSVFDLYGFMLSTPDASVAQYLKLFTFLPVATISATMTVQESDPSARPAQHLLAYELVSLVHGASAADEARAQHSLIFSSRSSTPASTSSTANSSIFALKPSAILPLSYILRTPISRLLMHADLNVQTRSEATRLIASGGCYLGRENEGGGLEFERLENAKMLLREEDLTRNGEGKMRVIVRRGKTLVKVLEVLEDVEFERRGLGRPGV